VFSSARYIKDLPIAPELARYDELEVSKWGSFASKISRGDRLSRQNPHAFFDIIKMVLGCADDLVVFVSFARQKHHIICLRVGQHVLNRPAAI
jgi:hypothetical protein